MSEFKATYVTRNINSKRLLKEIKTVADEVCNEYIYHRSFFSERTFEFEELISFLNMYFADLLEKKTITQFDIVGDARNNKHEDIRLGRINVSIKFRQLHCINVSSIDIVFELK